MKVSAKLAFAFIFVLGMLTIIAARTIQMPVTETVPIAEEHDVDLGYANPLNFTVAAGKAPYLTYNLGNGTVVRTTLTISGGSGNDIRLYIKDSAENIVFDSGRVSRTYSYDFVSQKNDSYRVFFDNSFSIISTKTVSYSVIKAYYTTFSYGPRTIYLKLAMLHPWVEWIGFGLLLLPLCVVGSFGVKFLAKERRTAIQARLEQEARLRSERESAAAREEQRLKEEEEQRRLAMKQNADNLMRSGRYEEAAGLFDQLKMWDEAGECRRLTRTSYVVAADVHVGKEGISVNCPHCGSSERLESKVSEVTCRHCGRKYFIPKKVLDMI